MLSLLTRLSRLLTRWRFSSRVLSCRASWRIGRLSGERYSLLPARFEIRPFGSRRRLDAARQVFEEQRLREARFRVK